MDNGELYGPHYLRPPRLLLRVARLQVQEDMQGKLQEVSQGKPAVHFTESLCACDGQCYGN